jgi:putative spermidine/putrescine transport system substrate-binding protein
MKFVKTVLITIFLFSAISLTACSKEDEKKGSNKETQTVVIAGWGGDPVINDYMNKTVKKYVKKTTGLEMKWMPMNADEYLAKLTNEKEAGKKGSIDGIWINGENFYYAKEKGLLFGPFLKKMDNAKKYLNLSDPAVNMDFGYPTDGYEAPWGKAQFSFFYDSAKVGNPPMNTDALTGFLLKNPGKFTYPEVTDFTGSAFLRTVLYDKIGFDRLFTMPEDKEKVRETIKPAMAYLNSIKPLLWKKGVTYPKDLASLEKLYQDGEVWLTMDYNTMKGYRKVEAGDWPKTTRPFLWEYGTPFNTHFLAIPFNSKNTDDAQKVINAILSVDMQVEKARVDGWGDAPVLEFSRLTAVEKEKFDAIKPNSENAANLILPQDSLNKYGKPELPAKLVALIEEIWKEDVLLAK